MRFGMLSGPCEFPVTDTHHVRMRPRRRPSTPSLEHLEHQPRRRRFGVGAALRLSVEYAAGATAGNEAVLQDISHSGAFVRTSIRPEVGQSALLRFTCGGVSCMAAGTVVDVRWRKGFAVELDGACLAYDTLFAELDAVRESVSRDILTQVGGVEIFLL